MLFLALSFCLAAVSGKGLLHLADPPTEVEFGYCGKKETGYIRHIDGALLPLLTFLNSLYLANQGEAKGCSTNMVDIH